MKILIWENEANQRLDRFLRKYFRQYPEVKLSDIFSWIRKWVILVNNKKKKQDYRLNLWDVINFNQQVENIIKKPTEFVISKEDKKLNISLEDIQKMILYEDDNWLVFNKLAWIVVHPWNKHINDLTLHDILDVYSEKFLKIKSDTFKPSFTFRLDRDTSWVIIAGKNYEALKYLNDLIRQRKVDKSYLTIVKWKFSEHQIIDLPIFRWFNKKFGRAQSFVNLEKWVYAKTEAWNVKTIKDKDLWYISLVKVKIYTWRMHQIRVHLSHLWYPILWDIMYWDEKLNKILYEKKKISRQLLHSWEYSFFDKFRKQKISFQAPIPDDFKKLIE